MNKEEKKNKGDEILKKEGVLSFRDLLIHSHSHKF